MTAAEPIEELHKIAYQVLEAGRQNLGTKSELNIL